MAKKHYLAPFLFFLLNILCFVQNQKREDVDWLSFWEGSGFTEKLEERDTKKRFAVEFNSTGATYTGPSYLKIEVKPKQGESPPLLCFSNDDPYCETRQILSRNPTGNSVVIWAKKEQFQDQNNEPYFVVTCPNNASKCSYSIEGTGNKNAVFSTDFVYSYLVTRKNKDMVFKIDKTGLGEGQRLVVCLEGSSTTEIRFNDAEFVAEENIRCCNIPIIQSDLDDEDFGKISIRNAKEDEYLTLSAHTYKIENDGNDRKLGRAQSGLVVPNGPIINGFIYSENTLEECFPISRDKLDKSSPKLAITGKIYTKYAWFFLEDNEGKWIDTTDEEIMDGLFSFVLDKENGDIKNKDIMLCFEIPHPIIDEEIIYHKQEQIIFSFQIVDYDKIIEPFGYTEPMIIGDTYRRLLPKGKIAYYYGGKAEDNIRYDITLTRRKGLPQLYLGECTFFPDCSFKKDDLKDLTAVSSVNNQKILILNKMSSSALGTQKPAFVVYCEDNELSEDFCEFDMNIFAKGQDIILIENEKFSKYVESGVGNLIVDLKRDRIIERITIDIMVLNGDISFEIQEPNVNYEKIYLSNKVLINIYKPKEVFGKATIKYNAALNSFFTIQYTVDSLNHEQSLEIVPSGESYLVQINPTSPDKKKDILMTNIFKEKSAFMTNFFELNCEFQVKRSKLDKEITFADGYAQENIEEGKIDNGYYYYYYEIKIKETEPSNYNNKMCMLYIAGYEVDSRTNEREIVVGSNINQQIIFEDNFNKIKFTYPIVNTRKEFIIRFNVIDRAYYRLTATLNGKNMTGIENRVVAVSTDFFVGNEDLRNHCGDSKLCIFNLVIEMTEKIVQTNPMIEVTFREVLNVPTYLQKGNTKLDFVCGDKFYYLYTDIGRNDVGEITLNFLREFGAIWAKVVHKDQKTPEKEADWRGMYRMPGPKWEDGLKFDDYTKKVKIDAELTKECVNGCYLLMTIQINDIGEYVPDFILYFFSIMVKVTSNKKTYTDIPKVIIQVDEFIVGSLDTTEMDDRYISEFYQVWLPHDSEVVEFDWQSTVAGLYINIGDSRPTVKSADFILYAPSIDSVLSITKEQILEVVKRRGIHLDNDTSIQDVSIVIGVWTNETDSIKYELYSLRVHQYTESDDFLEITEASSDQKVVCKPRKIKVGYDITYRCLVMITYTSDSSINSPLYIYGYSTFPSAYVNLYGSFIDADIYNGYKINELKQLIPTESNAEYNTYNLDTNYIYITKLPVNKYFFVNFYSNSRDDIILINSIPLFNLLDESKSEIYPNSYTTQLLSLTNGQLKLKFAGEEGIAATVEVLSGEASLGWQDSADQFKLNGEGDRITLFSDIKNRNLVVYKNNNPYLSAGMEDPGFLFIIKYKARTNGFNFDEAEFGKSTEIAYKDTDLPAVLYCFIGDKLYKDLIISISFKDNSEQAFGDYVISPIKVQASIMREDTIYITKRKKDMDMVPLEKNSVYGYYDPAVKTALIYFSKDRIAEYNIDDSEDPTLYLRIEKTNRDETTYNKFNIEAQIEGINDFTIPLEKVYHYGKFGKDTDDIFYILKSAKDKEFIRIQIAFNSDEFDFTINNLPGLKQNMTFDYMRASKERGKIIYTFKRHENDNGLFLNIFRKENSTRDERLSNYVFKYINGKAETDFYDYKTMSNELNCTSSKGEYGLNKIRCTLNQIHADIGEADITYFLKVVRTNNYLKGEEMNTIAVTESESQISYLRNPVPGADGDSDKIEIQISCSFSSWGYINVIAQIQQNNIIEYSAYNGILELKPEPIDPTDSSGHNTDKTDADTTDNNPTDPNKGDKNEESDNTVLFGVMGGILGAIAIGLVVVIVVFQLKNKKLLDQVKHVSFQKTNATVDPNLLLQRPSEGEINPA